MSGAAGGTRIPRAAVQKTVDDFIEKILSKIPGFKSAKISGSYNRPVKQDFGDVDLIVSIESEEDKKTVKKYITDYFNSLPDNEMPELKSEKHKGKKAINHGEIVTNLYPISGMPGEFVQIDNIIAVSEAEGEFKKTVLDYPAELQGLILGLIKTPMLEEDPQAVLNRMGIKDVPALGKDQEYEFHVDTTGLSLRIVTLDENFRTLNINTVWKSSSWDDVKKLLKDFNLDKFEFKNYIEKIKQFKNPRSKNRVKGYFKASIKVGPAEAGTPKGDDKQKALDTVASLEERYGSLVTSLIKPFLTENVEETIAIFPGKFKPPHKDHLARAQAAAKAADKVIIYIGPNPKDDFTAQQAENVFNFYKEKGLLPSNVEVKISDLPSPVLKAYKEFENNPDQKYIAVFGKDDAARFKGLSKMTNVEMNNFPEANIGDLSASDLRAAILDKDLATIENFLPKGVTAEEYLKILEMPLTENKGGKKLRVFDFDDTLAHIKALIRITHEDGSQEELTPAEYAVYTPQKGDTFNFSDFNKIIRQARPIESNVQDLIRSYNDPTEKTTILTARMMGYPVKKYLKDEFGIEPYVVGLGSSDPMDKARWIEQQIHKGYTDIEFRDDSQKNVDAVATLKDKYPEIQLTSMLAESHRRKKDSVTVKEPLVEDVNFNALEKALDEMFDDLDIDINFTEHFKERVLERGLTEEDIVELMSKIHDKYGDEIADMPKDSNRVFTHLQRLVDIASAMGPYGYDGLRDLYLTTAYKRKSKNEPEFRTNRTSPKLKVTESYKGKRTNDGAPGTLKAKITKLYGGDVTIEKAKKLKNRKNATAHDKRQANWFINFHSKNENVIPKEDESAAPYGSGYKKLKEQEEFDRVDFYLNYFTNVSPSTFNLVREGDNIKISDIYKPYPEGFDDKETRQLPVEQYMQETLMPYVASLTEYMVRNGLAIDDAPEVHFVDDPNNAENVFGRTAFYDPNEKGITLYITGRHPKDILRSFAHEMIHYCQDCEGRLHHTYTTDINEDDRLMELEREAYERGNMYFRSWENSLNENDRKGIKAYSLELVRSLQETKSRYNVPVKELVKKIFTSWKEQYDGKEGVLSYTDSAGSLTSKAGNTFYFELDANLTVKETPEGIYAVNEPTGVDPDVDPEEGDPTFDINIQVDPRDLPNKWSDIYYDLIDIVRHEIEHLTHFGPDALDSKRLEDDKVLRLLIDKGILSKADYFKLPAEVDAMLQGMALKAKKKKEPFIKTLNDYLDLQDLTQEEKDDILNLWRKRAPALALPKF